MNPRRKAGIGFAGQSELEALGPDLGGSTSDPHCEFRGSLTFFRLEIRTSNDYSNDRWKIFKLLGPIG